MKDEANLEYAETHQIASWTAVAVAVGTVLHRIFSLVAPAIAIVAPVGLFRKHEGQTARSR